MRHRDYEAEGYARFFEAVMGKPPNGATLLDRQMQLRLQHEYDHSLMGARFKFAAALDIAVEEFNRLFSRAKEK